LFVYERSKDQVHVIGHNNNAKEIYALIVLMDT